MDIEGNFPVARIKDDFPALQQQVYGRPLVYLDNAATTQKPLAVLTATTEAYIHSSANVHRGVHFLSAGATKAFEETRQQVQQFINAEEASEIIFVHGATQGINLVAHSYGLSVLQPGDEIIVSLLEHHANIVPWQLVAARTGAKLRVIGLTDTKELDLEAYKRLLTPKTKIVAITQVSNALGVVNPIIEITALAHEVGAVVLVDGAQAIVHTTVDVQRLGADFYVFSGHKLYGPTGVGVLYGKRALLEAMPPYEGGGDMIKRVTFAETTYNDIPYKFEAGTPNIIGVLGLKAALTYLLELGREAIFAYEDRLYAYGLEALQQVKNLRLFSTKTNNVGVWSFELAGVHAHDVGTILDRQGIAIRTGHHCAQPLMDFLQVPATARASLGLYNTTADIDSLVAALSKVQRIFGK